MVIEMTETLGTEYGVLGGTSTEEVPVELTIDELSAETGVSSRTIRFYQSKGALPSPKRKGRIAVYSQDHVDRLKAIVVLQDKGLRLDAICNMLNNPRFRVEDLDEWLGVGERLREWWVNDHPIFLTHAELVGRLGRLVNLYEINNPDAVLAASPGRYLKDELSLDAIESEIVEEMERLGVIHQDRSQSNGEGEPDTSEDDKFFKTKLPVPSSEAAQRLANRRYYVRSPGLLASAAGLHEAGLPWLTIRGSYEILSKALEDASRELLVFFLSQFASDPAEGRENRPDFETIKNLSIESVRLIFAREMNNRLREFVAAGGSVSGVMKDGADIEDAVAEGADRDGSAPEESEGTLAERAEAPNKAAAGDSLI